MTSATETRGPDAAWLAALEPLFVYHGIGAYARIFEDELRRHMIDWNTWGLDTTLFWYDALRRFRDGHGLPVGGLLSEKEADQLLQLPQKYWRRSRGLEAFRASPREKDPSVYGSRVALSLVKALNAIHGYREPLGRDRACTKLGADKVQRMIEFVQRCRINDGQFEGGFKTSPWSPIGPTVRTTHAAFFVLWDLEYGKVDAGEWGKVVRGTREFLCRCLAAAGPRQGRGFSEWPEHLQKPPITCATYYGVSALTKIQEITRESLDHALRDEILCFLAQCWEDSGGFRSTVRALASSEQPSLPHTVFAVQCMRRLDGGESLPGIRPDIFQDKVRAFVSSCRVPGGYSLKPRTSSAPFCANIFATRQVACLAYPSTPEARPAFPDLLSPEERQELVEEISDYPASKGGERPGLPVAVNGAAGIRFKMLRWLANLVLRPPNPMTATVPSSLRSFHALLAASALFLVLCGAALGAVLAGFVARSVLSLAWALLYVACSAFALLSAEAILLRSWDRERVKPVSTSGVKDSP